MKMKNVTIMENEELLINLESLFIRFVKEDDMGYNTDKTNEQIETIKAEILRRLSKNSHTFN